jgi:ATP-dependent RNA helicase RhlE
VAEHPADSSTAPATGFDTLGLLPALAAAAQQRFGARPTPVQQAVIPAALAGRDLQVLAPTGAGKTAAYALPLLHALHRRVSTQPPPRPGQRRSTRALVLVPTRELALQVGAVLKDLAGALTIRLQVEVVHGGVAVNPQMLRLRGGADALVATPGRLLDLVAQRAVTLEAVALLVLDEADRLLEPGFADELQQVLALLPARRQQGLYSATFPPAVQALATALLHQPLVLELQGQVAAGAAATPSVGSVATDHEAVAMSIETAADAELEVLPPQITQRAIVVDNARRAALLRHLLRDANWRPVLVFVATRYSAELLASKLGRWGVHTAALHGELGQSQRARVLSDFGAGRLQALVATDLAARGLHIDALPVVLNYDLARSPADHVHRIGRTGRAGAAGLAVSFVIADAPGSEAHFRLIEKRQGRRVPREQLPGFEPQAPLTVTAETSADDVPGAAPGSPGTGLDPHGGVKGRRKSRKDKLREAAAAALSDPANPEDPP